MSGHRVQWVTAGPLWHSVLEHESARERSISMRTPALLRFERDSFMEDLAHVLERDPRELSTLIATPATYRLPAPGDDAPTPPKVLKLFQAVHGHFYLVAATLACQLPGLPEHEVNAAARERVAFVLRRVHGGHEWAWIVDPSLTGGKRWKQLSHASAERVDREEELLPLFPVRYSDRERLRRVFVGLVPTASGDAFKAAGVLSPLAGAARGATGGVPDDPRVAALKAKVTDVMRALMATPPSAAAASLASPDADPANAAAIERAAREQQVDASRYVLLDFAELLNKSFGWFEHDPPVAPAPGRELDFWIELLAPVVPGSDFSWIDALGTAWRERRILGGEDTSGATSTLTFNLRLPGIDPDVLDAAFAGLTSAKPAPEQDPHAAVSIQGDVTAPPAAPKLDAKAATRYVLRCVYQRPDCGPLTPDVVSEPSEEFTIASFFDLDAPSRAITISMPLDTSIKDLRKLRKNVNFLLSNQLRAQMNRVTSLKDALNGQFAAGESVDLGMICSFSIPIITICALIVLMIFISLLNIVFWWLPFLRICFPIPLKGGRE